MRIQSGRMQVNAALLASGLCLPACAAGLTAVSASSEQARHPAAHVIDGKPETFWVSFGTTPGLGPSDTRPETLDFLFAEPTTLGRVILRPRPAYGPRRGAVEVSSDGKNFARVASFEGRNKDGITCDFPAATGLIFRLRFTDAHDPLQPAKPRNVQVAEVVWSGPSGTFPKAAKP